MEDYLDKGKETKSGNFIITNQVFDSKTIGLTFIRKVFDYHVYFDQNREYIVEDDLIILIEGNIQPMNEYYTKFESSGQKELILKLIKLYDEKFISYIKGNFIVIIIDNESISIFTDQLGLQNCYIYQSTSHKVVLDSLSLLKYLKVTLEPDPDCLAIKATLHRTPHNFTKFKFLNRTLPGTHIKIINNEIRLEQYWKVDSLLELSKEIGNVYSYNEFAELLKTNFHNFLTFAKPKQHAITLTGGKDSRTGLACLMALGINPYGFTYGNYLSRDSLYARKLSEEISLPHYIFSAPDNEPYYNDITDELIRFGNPDINLHRAHRLFAFKKMEEKLTGSSAYYAGYMAGEFLMGVYYDNLVFTRLLTNFWDTSIKFDIKPILENHFLRTESINLDEVSSRLDKLQTFNSSLSIKDRQFYGMFEIGIPHHGQDIFLAGKYFDYVYPFFLDIDFLEALFRSKYSFSYADNKTINLLKRYDLYKFNLNIQHILFPEMDEVSFGKRGSYNTSEFLRGKYYWSFIKTLRYILHRKKYPVNYNYSKTFRNFILKHLLDLDNEGGHILNDYYDISKAISALLSINKNTSEVEMHRFSDIVMLYLQMQNYNYRSNS